MRTRLAAASVLLAGALAGGARAQGFDDVTTAAGLGGAYTPFPGPSVTAEISGGVAVFDYDGDGWDDVFWPGGTAPARLYHNDGDGTFTDLAPIAGLDVVAPIMAPAHGDYDGDGDLDLFLSTYVDYSYEGGPVAYRDLLFRNEGDGTFTEVAQQAGLAQAGRQGASWGDLDRDRDLDLVVVTWTGDVTHFWRNEGDGTFTDATPRAITDDAINGFSPTIVDYDGDGDQDVLSANDFQASRVWRNDGDWVFTRVDETIVDGQELDDDNGMGSALGDVDNDGDLDWLVTSTYAEEIPKTWLPKTGNRLWRGNGDGTFTDSTDQGVRDGGWGWGAQMGDLDNDAILDVVHVNGFYVPAFPQMQWLETLPPRVFLQQPLGTFTDGAEVLGIDDVAQGRGCVVFDYDHDGLLDILSSNNDVGLILYRNEKLIARTYLYVELRGGSLSNTYGIGARVTLSHPELPTQTRWITLGCNHVSMSPPGAWFGLDGVETGLQVTVKWPSGLEQTLRGLRAGRRLTIVEPETAAKVPGP